VGGRKKKGAKMWKVRNRGGPLRGVSYYVYIYFEFFDHAEGNKEIEEGKWGCPTFLLDSVWGESHWLSG